MAKPKPHQSAAARVVSRPRKPTRPVLNRPPQSPGVQLQPGGGNGDFFRSQIPGLQPQSPQGGGDPYSAANLVGLLANQGIQASTTPHPNDVGWGDYGNGLWVYAPQGPGSSGDPLGSFRGDIASLTDPYLADSYKQSALQDLTGGPQMLPGGVANNPNLDLGGADKNALLQAIQQQMIDKGQQVPSSVTDQLGQTQTPVAPTPTDNTTAAPVNANSAPTSTVVTAPSPVDTAQNPFGSAAPPPNLLANRSLPGFAAVNHRPPHPQHPIHPMIGFGNLGSIAQRMLQRHR